MPDGPGRRTSGNFDIKESDPLPLLTAISFVEDLHDEPEIAPDIVGAGRHSDGRCLRFCPGYCDGWQSGDTAGLIL